MPVLNFEDYNRFYLSLKDYQLVNSAYDFSLNFLGGNISTFSVWKVKKNRPSYAVQLTLIHKLAKTRGIGKHAAAANVAIEDMLRQLRLDLANRVAERLRK